MRMRAALRRCSRRCAPRWQRAAAARHTRDDHDGEADAVASHGRGLRRRRRRALDVRAGARGCDRARVGRSQAGPPSDSSSSRRSDGTARSRRPRPQHPDTALRARRRLDRRRTRREPRRLVIRKARRRLPRRRRRRARRRSEGGREARIAWVGPQELRSPTAFTARRHGTSNPGTIVLRAWSSDLPPCKEAALGAIARGAVVVMAHGGIAPMRRLPARTSRTSVGASALGLRAAGVPSGPVVRDAVAGVYRGGEDIVFGAASGAIGVRQLDPRISRRRPPCGARRAGAAVVERSPPSG